MIIVPSTTVEMKIEAPIRALHEKKMVGPHSSLLHNTMWFFSPCPQANSQHFKCYALKSRRALYVKSHDIISSTRDRHKVLKRYTDRGCNHVTSCTRPSHFFSVQHWTARIKPGDKARISYPNTSSICPWLRDAYAVNTSGAPLPMASRVIPAMLGERWSLWERRLSGGTKKLSACRSRNLHKV